MTSRNLAVSGLRSLIGALLLALAIGPLSLGVSSAASAAIKVDRQHADHLKGKPRASGIDQCSKPLDQRTGSWFCPRAKASPGDPVPLDGWCQSIPDPTGCFYVNSDLISSYSDVTGFYGFNDTQIGSADLSFNMRLNGAQSVSQPIFSSSAYAKSIVFEGERLYISAAYPEGKGVNGGDSYAFYNAGSHDADGVSSWQPNGYKYYENTVAHGAVVHEVSWQDGNYPGTWYVYLKSPIFDMTRSSYRLTTAQNVPDDPAGSGWHATS